MFKLNFISKGRNKEADLRVFIFSLVKILIILISVSSLLLVTISVRNTVDQTLFTEPVSLSEEETFFHLEQLKEVGVPWGIKVE